MNSILIKKISESTIVVIFSILFYIIIKQIISNTFLKKARKDYNKKALTIINVITNIIKYMLIVIDLTMILDIFGVDTKALLASIGVVGIIVGLALQDILKDIIGGTAILTEDQFKVGDNIKINDFRGEVISLGLKTTKVKAYTGEIKIISNRNITEVINYSTSPSKCILDIDTSYEDNIEKIKEALETICKKLSTGIDYVIGKVKILGVEELKDSSICFRIVADTKPTYDTQFKRLFLEEIVREFKKRKLKIPYPKVEVHHEK